MGFDCEKGFIRVFHSRKGSSMKILIAEDDFTSRIMLAVERPTLMLLT